MPGPRIGSYQVLGTLGKGAHSTLLHIRRNADSKNYALKVVSIGDRKERKFLDQARHEFEVAQLLDHPNLIKIYSMEMERDWLFRTNGLRLLIEYVAGGTLDTLKRLPMPQLVQLFAKIAAGLTHMHRRNVYHADLKPNNILLSRAGDVKIIDYGLAWIKGQPKGRVQGTPQYMAPEQIKQGIVNVQTDIYNFGATMYRLTTWRLPPDLSVIVNGMPMDSKSWKQILKPVQECNSEVPAELANTIEQCLWFNPKRRPDSVSEVKDVLDELAKKLVRTPEDQLESIQW
jgi:serine/threonine protein kinase